MSSGPFYSGQPYARSARLTTGDNSFTAPTLAAKIFDPTDGASGKTVGAVMRITCAPVSAIASGTAVHIFRSTDGGVTFRYLFSIPIPATAVQAGSMAVQQQSAAIQALTSRYPVMVGVGDTIWASVNDTVTGLDVTAEGGIG